MFVRYRSDFGIRDLAVAVGRLGYESFRSSDISILVRSAILVINLEVLIPTYNLTLNEVYFLDVLSFSV